MYSSRETTISLEQHLKSLCENDLKYSKLYATWDLDKRIFKDVLMAINYNYPHYSLHEMSHAESIINKIEMVLGESRIKQLGPTEIWMILQSAYVHDFGMVLEDEYVKEVWRGDEFQTHIKQLMETSLENDIKKAATFIYNISNGGKINSENSITCEREWPIDLRRAIVQMIAEYFRSKHTDLSKRNINDGSKWGIDFSHNGLIPLRLIKLLGEISQLHGADFKEVLNLRRQANGVATDIIHPRFIACMLRLGDLLDMDNGRFNPFLNKVFGKLPTLSIAHEEKHAAIEHFFINSDRIEVTANCQNDLSYRITRQWCDWIIQEIELLAVNWLQVVPSDILGVPPRAGEIEVLLKGRKNNVGVANLQFQISQGDAFELLEGANVYKNKFAFVRELYQNALDATKIRIWQDIMEGYYTSCFDGWISGDELLPYHIKDKSFLENYKIKIDIQYDATGGMIENKNAIFQFSIKDRGTGIHDDDLYNMAQVGKSWRKRKRWAPIIKSMPRWLRPTGTFGIGLQSVFLITDSITAFTKAEGENAKEVTFVAKKDNGYISVSDLHFSKQPLQRGTEMVLNFSGIHCNSISGGGYVDNKLRTYDMFIDNIPESVLRIVEEIMKCAPNIISTEIYVNGKIFENIPAVDIYNSSFELEGKIGYDENTSIQCRYSIKNDLACIYIFENKLQSIIKIDFWKDNLSPYGAVALKVKGVKAKYDDYSPRYMNIYWDIWGMDTKELLTLNREGIREDNDNRIILMRTLQCVIKFSLEKLAERLLDCGTQLDKLDLMSIRLLFEEWLTVTELERNKYSDLLKLIGTNCHAKLKVAVYKEGKYVKEQIDASEFFSNITDFAIVVYNKKNVGDTDELVDDLNNHKTNEPVIFKYLVLDEYLPRWYVNFGTNDVQALTDAIYVAQIIDPLNPPSDCLNIDVDSSTKVAMLKDLSTSNRGFLPPLSEYLKLRIQETPSWIFRHRNHAIGSIWKDIIISPLIKSDIEDLINRKITVDGLIGVLSNRRDFFNLKQWVFDKQLNQTAISMQEIEELYFKLVIDIANAFG